MVLELRDKLGPAGRSSPREPVAPKSLFSTTEEDVISALMNFGANRASAEAAVNKARSESGMISIVIRHALLAAAR